MTPQWKRFYFARRNASLTRDEFPARWRQHAELGGSFPDGLRRHPRINYGIVEAIDGGTPTMQFDGIGILWLGSPEWLDRASGDPAHRPTMQRDELLVFTQPVYDSAMVVEEHIAMAGPLGKSAILRFMKRADGVSEESFGQACDAIGAKLAGGGSGTGVRRVAWSSTVRPPTIAFDCAIEFWFDTAKDAAAAMVDAQFDADAFGPLDFVARAGEGEAGSEGTPADRDVTYVVEICHERLGKFENT